MINSLATLLEDSVRRTLEPRVAIAFSGGLDSSTIATIAKHHADVQLITVSAGPSPDLEVARLVAAELRLPLHEVELTPDLMVEDFRACWAVLPGSVVDMELMIGTWACAREAHRLHCPVMLTGSGAEELFVGYHKYYEAHAHHLDLSAILDDELRTLPQRDLHRAKITCARHQVIARFPFMDPLFIQAVRAIPLEQKLDDGVAKKPLLRKIAAQLGVPKLALERPKKAMQYGSRIHTMMRHLMDEGRIPKLNVRVAPWMAEMREKESK